VSRNCPEMPGKSGGTPLAESEGAGGLYIYGREP
jgi:hypothetical protein